MVASHLKINWDDTADGIAVTFKIKNKNRSQVRMTRRNQAERRNVRFADRIKCWVARCQQRQTADLINETLRAEPTRPPRPPAWFPDVPVNLFVSLAAEWSPASACQCSGELPRWSSLFPRHFLLLALSLPGNFPLCRGAESRMQRAMKPSRNLI